MIAINGQLMKNAPTGHFYLAGGLVPVGVYLVGTTNCNTDVCCLLWCQLGELSTKLIQVQPCNLFINVFGQQVDFSGLVLVSMTKQFNLCQDLIGKLLLITKLGWPVPQPKLTSLPSANKIMR